MDCQYRPSGEALLKFRKCTCPATEEALFVFYSKFAKEFGPALIPFFIRRECLVQIPYKALGLNEIDPAQFTQREGEMWVLFCFKGELLRGQEQSPVRSDGFVLILEWRKDKPDSEFLSPAFHELANLVRRQQGVEGWGLYPASARYGDKIIDFTDNELFSEVASAYGALMAGLYCVRQHRYPAHWPFPTMQWDSALGRISGVGGLHEKIFVAKDYGARVITVAKGQEDVAGSVIRNEIALKHQVKIYGVSPIMNHELQAEKIAFGFEKRQKLVKYLLLLALLPLVLVLATMGIFYWDMTRDVVEYYRGHELLFGADVGHEPIAHSQIDGRGAYEFVYRGWRHSTNGWTRRLQQVAHIDGEGKLIPFPCASKQEEMRKECSERAVVRHAYEYGEDGTPSEMHEISESGVLRGIVKFVKGNKYRIEHIVFDKQGIRINPENAPKYIEYHDDGKLRKYIQYDPFGNYFEAYLNDQGSMTRQEFHAPDGSLLPDPAGVAVYKFEYLPNGLELGRCFYSKDMTPVLSRNTGTSGYTNVYDSVGNILRVVMFGADGKSIGKNNDGVAIIDRVYDEKNRVVEEWTKDEFENPVVPRRLTSDTDCGVLYEYDSNGFKIAEKYVDSKRRAALRNGVSCLRWTYHLNGRQRRFYGTNDCLVVSQEGCAGIDEIMDEHGRTVKVVSVGIDNCLCTNSLGFAILERQYDEYGRVKFEAWFDTSTNPVPLRVNGCEKIGKFKSVVYNYDNKTGLRTDKYAMIDDTDDVAFVKCTILPNGDLWKMQYFNSFDQLVSGPDGWAQKEHAYNGERCCTGIRCLDANGALCADALYGVAYAFCQYQRADNGLNVGMHFMGVNNYHVNGPDGFASMSLSYDSSANLTRFAFRDKNDNPIMVAELVYAANGRIIRFGSSLLERLMGDGVVAVSFDYDMNGTVAVVRGIGATGAMLNEIAVDGASKDKLKVFLDFITALRTVFRLRNNYFAIEKSEQELLKQAIVRMKQLQ